VQYGLEVIWIGPEGVGLGVGYVDVIGKLPHDSPEQGCSDRHNNKASHLPKGVRWIDAYGAGKGLAQFRLDGVRIRIGLGVGGVVHGVRG